MDDKENQLVAMVLAGNPDAFEPLVRPYRRALLGLAYRITGNEEDAREAAQEALLNSYRYLGGFDQRRSFRNWLLRILVNAAREAARSSSSNRALGLNDGADPVEPAEGPAGRFERKELGLRLKDCLAVLSERERAVFLLRDIEERSIRDTAEILGCSSASVRVHLSRARIKVKAELERRYPGLAGGGS